MAFVLDNADDIFAEETAGPEELPGPTEPCTGRSRKGGLCSLAPGLPETCASRRHAVWGFAVGFAFCVLVLQDVAWLHVLLLSRAVLGRAKWPCSQSR